MSNTVLFLAVTVIIALILLSITTPPNGTTLCALKDGGISAIAQILPNHYGIDRYISAKQRMFQLMYLLYVRPASPIMSSTADKLKSDMEDLSELYLEQHPASTVPSLLQKLFEDGVYQARQGWSIIFPQKSLEALATAMKKDNIMPNVSIESYISQVNETFTAIANVSDKLFRREYNLASKMWENNVEARYFLSEA